MTLREIVWTEPASAQLDQVGLHIAADNPSAAIRVVRRIAAAADSLATLPARGRNGRVPGTRELVLNDAPYILAYRVTPASVEILAIVHVARQWPDELSAPQRHCE